MKLGPKNVFDVFGHKYEEKNFSVFFVYIFKLFSIGASRKMKKKSIPTECLNVL